MDPTGPTSGSCRMVSARLRRARRWAWAWGHRVGNRVNVGNDEDKPIGVSDQGYFDLILTYGVPGTVLILVSPSPGMENVGAISGTRN